jgi:hypothetical protein
MPHGCSGDCECREWRLDPASLPQENEETETNDKDPTAQANITNEKLDYLLKTCEGAIARRDFLENERAKYLRPRDPKRFRIERLRVNSVQVDTEPAEPVSQASQVEWDNLIVSITDKDGSQFEVARVRVQRNGCVGESTYVAKLVCKRSWGEEEDDDSVSCPLCLFQGHGAGACKGRC